MKLTEMLKTQLKEARETAAQGWEAFETYRKDNGDEKIGNDKELFAEADRLHKVYSTATDAVKEIEASLFKAMDWDGEGPSLKDIGEDAANATERKDVRRDTLSFLNLAEKAADVIEKSAAYEAYRGDSSKTSNAISSGSLFAVEQALSRAELKTLITGVLTGQPVFLLPDMQPGMVEGFDRVDRVMTQLITVGQTDIDKVEWVQEDSFTNAAAETLEAVNADKAAGAAPSTAPESAIGFSLKSTDVRELKHHIPATKRSLADIGQMRTIVDQELLYGLDLRVDSQIINGDGIDPNLKGILNTAGLQTQPRGADTNVDAIHKAMTKLIISGYRNISVLLNANDWQSIRLAKDANGIYYYGPPSMSGEQILWGRPVTLSQNLAAGTGIVSDFKRSCTMWLREGMSIAATDSHSDWFLKGIIAVLAQMRAAFAVVRPRGVCTVTSLA